MNNISYNYNRKSVYLKLGSSVGHLSSASVELQDTFYVETDIFNCN